MPKYRIRTTTEADIEYHVEAESIADVVERWNAGGEVQEALVGGDFDNYHTLDLGMFACSDDLAEHEVKELVELTLAN